MLIDAIDDQDIPTELEPALLIDDAGKNHPPSGTSEDGGSSA